MRVQSSNYNQAHVQRVLLPDPREVEANKQIDQGIIELGVIGVIFCAGVLGCMFCTNGAAIAISVNVTWMSTLWVCWVIKDLRNAYRTLRKLQIEE